MTSRINYIAVIVCVVLHALLGMAWFGYWADPWTRLLGRSMDDMRNASSTMPYVWSFLEAIVFALLIGWLLTRMKKHSLVAGLKLGFIIGACTIGIAAITNYQFAMRPMKLAMIDFGFPVLSLTMMGAVQGAWRNPVTTITKLVRS
jgi:hypothetical protein